MKTSYWFAAVFAVIAVNAFLADRDAKLFEAYDKLCAELPQPHPNCRYAK